ncbi:MAG TPA: glycerol kinase GlpK [Chitinophagales bacterium]|nr:glycerol kinase GlpK [Chitinophagales bacterium]
MKSTYIIALDQGTTSCRSILFDEKGQIVGMTQQEFTQIYPKTAWVEHDPNEIWDTQLYTLRQLLQNHHLQAKDIAAIGITNQRETTVVWEKATGKPIYNAIVWQDRRTAEICNDLKNKGLSDYVRQQTGLVIDAYFSGTKIKWLLDNIPSARQQAEKGELLFGTIDTWLIWKLTQGQTHATDYSNASRTLLFNINTLEWDKKLLNELDIPDNMLPQVMDSNAHFGKTHPNLLGTPIPICGVAGDQQAALFGQACFQKGMAKNTYGTGCFMLMNTGTKPIHSQNGLITTIAWGINGNQITYALEGSVFIAGAAIQWLRDGLKILDSAPDSEYFALKVPDSDGVIVVPAFAGLGAPHWDMYARGAIFGLTRRTNKFHLIRATLESLAYQTTDVLQAMESDSHISLAALRVDGGASANNLLMQLQADLLNTPVERPRTIETTALGAAYLAATAIGLLTTDDIAAQWQKNATFKPNMPDDLRQKSYKRWQKAVERCKNWADDDL